jgi:hypothetical protein
MIEIREDCIPEIKIPDGAVLIIGAGHFGQKACRVMRASERPVLIVDIDPGNLDAAVLEGASALGCDGVRFLCACYSRLDSETIIVPAVPVHLAFEWMKDHLSGLWEVSRIEVPPEIAGDLPNSFRATEGSVLVSYADFICPDNCPEPEHCTVTGEKRTVPLYNLLSNISFMDWNVAVLRSRQLAPGLGGYSAGDLAALADTVMDKRGGNWLICTSCSCHAIVTACKITPSYSTGRLISKAGD